MKTLFLIRHAKSSWDNLSISDFERPLNERGKKDAPEMAKKLKAKKIKIDVFVSSPAKRAKKTAKYFAKEFDHEKKDIILEPKLYEASEENFYEVAESFKNKWNAVALFSHNPGITYFINSLTDFKTDNVPTSGIVGFKINTKKWADIKSSEKEFLFFDYPKSGAE